MTTNRITLIPAEFNHEPTQMAFNFIDTAITNEMGAQGEEVQTTIERNTHDYDIKAKSWGALRVRCTLTGREIHFMMPVYEGTTVHAVNNNEWLAMFDQASTIVSFKLTENIHLRNKDGEEVLAFIDGKYLSMSILHTEVALVDSLQKDANIIHLFYKGGQAF